jgi:hypothetical protein
MGKLTELGAGFVASVVIAVAYGVAVTIAYPLAPIDSASVGLFALAGLCTYLIIRSILKRVAR